jgi:hypothetical protein
LRPPKLEERRRKQSSLPASGVRKKLLFDQCLSYLFFSMERGNPASLFDPSRLGLHRHRRLNSRRANGDTCMLAPIDRHPVLSRRQLLRTAGSGVMLAGFASPLHAEQPTLAGAAAGFP